MIGDINLSMRGRLLWLACAMLIGLASQYCINYGICAAPMS